MKIAIISDWFSENMGYAENYFPPALARLGHTVSIVTSDLQVYATSPDYDRLYRDKLGDKHVDQGVTSYRSCSLHRLRSRVDPLGISIPSLDGCLRSIAPDVVYCFEISCPTTLAVARLRTSMGYATFCESRLHASIYGTASDPWSRLKRWVRGRALDTKTIVQGVDRFYPIAPDVLANITVHLGVPKEKCTLASLAVETGIFNTTADENAVRELRGSLGYRSDDIVCVYTGRFTEDKGPHILAQAIDRLHSVGYQQFKGLFVGQGGAGYESLLASCSGCRLHPFVESMALAKLYQACDIGVWPRQESTSQLDAMACGLPLVINDTVTDPVRLGRCTATFRIDDPVHLADVLLTLDDAKVRGEMGAIGAERIRAAFSWDAVARLRVRDFESVLEARGQKSDSAGPSLQF